MESAHSFVSSIGTLRFKNGDIKSIRKFSRSCIDEHFLTAIYGTYCEQIKHEIRV